MQPKIGEGIKQKRGAGKGQNSEEIKEKSNDMKGDESNKRNTGRRVETGRKTLRKCAAVGP